MRLLQALRSNPTPTATEPADAVATGDADSPIADYDGLDARHVVAQLAHCSQDELATIEAHERSRQDRPEVLNKLRYLRGSEPLHGYDGLDPEEISTALEGADPETAKLVREYERKFKRRPKVLDAVARAGATRQTTST